MTLSQLVVYEREEILMATAPVEDQTMFIREQVARIDKMQAESAKLQVELQKVVADTLKVQQDTKFAPYTVLATGAGAAAALIAAGAALAKLLIG